MSGKNYERIGKRNALTAYAKANCYNFNKQNNECLPADKTCKILRGLACSHFRDAVLRGCDPSYPYAKNIEKYRLLEKLYRKIAPALGNVVEEVKARVCGCGQPLKPRKQLCDKCARKRRLQGERERSRKNRLFAAQARTQSTKTALCK